MTAKKTLLKVKVISPTLMTLNMFASITFGWIQLCKWSNILLLFIVLQFYVSANKNSIRGATAMTSHITDWYLAQKQMYNRSKGLQVWTKYPSGYICAKPPVLTLIKHHVTSKVSEPLACKSIKNLHVQNFCSPCWLQEKHWRWAYDRMASNIFLIVHKIRRYT